MISEFVARTRHVLCGLLKEAAFKETWLVGSTADQVFQLWPLRSRAGLRQTAQA